MGEDFTQLSFFTERNGKMLPVDRTILPVKHSGGLQFELPRYAVTLVVRDSGGKVVSKWTWKGSRFTKD